MSISVLLPSRARAQSLRETITGLRALAAAPGSVEILVAADADDEPTMQAATDLDVKVTVFGQRYGYARLHEYVNALAADASGDWQLLFNDDARMLTRGWDQRIRQCRPGVLWPRHNGRPNVNAFPVVHAAIVRLIGRWSPVNHCDAWMQAVAEAAGIHSRVDIDIWHDHPALTGGHNDQTGRESAAAQQPEAIYAPDMCQAREHDAALIRAHMGETTCS